MRRRQVLASGAALLSVSLAGCAHPSVVLDMNEATAAAIADELSTTAEPGSEEHSVVTTALENGSATRSGRSELFYTTDTVRVDGTVYRVSETSVDRTDVTVYEVRIDVNPETTTSDLGTIEFAELPGTDRQQLDSALSRDPPSTNDGYEVGINYGTAADVGNDSVFVPEQQYDIVVYDGDRYRVTTASESASEVEYRYAVTEVAPSVGVFADQIREQYLVALSGLSDAERSVVEAAIDGGHFEESDAFESVIGRIREHEGLNVDDFYGTWLVEYDGTAYLTYAEW
jgi:hypothetical protein